MIFCHCRVHYIFCWAHMSLFTLCWYVSFGFRLITLRRRNSLDFRTLAMVDSDWGSCNTDFSWAGLIFLWLAAFTMCLWSRELNDFGLPGDFLVAQTMGNLKNCCTTFLKRPMAAAISLPDLFDFSEPLFGLFRTPTRFYLFPWCKFSKEVL